MGLIEAGRPSVLYVRERILPFFKLYRLLPTLVPMSYSMDLLPEGEPRTKALPTPFWWTNLWAARNALLAMRGLGLP
jgi:hypothetical protein